MRAVRFDEFGGPEVLDCIEVEPPNPAIDEVLVRVASAGINPVDAKLRAGAFEGKSTDDRLALPRTPGSDFSGVVETVGEGVSDFAVGDRVCGAVLHTDRRWGSYAEYVTAPTDRLAPLPEDVSHRVGAAIGVVGVTAWRAVIDHAMISLEDTCLIHGGSGGVGHVAVQLAALSGATVMTTVGSTDAAAAVSDLGADFIYRFDQDDVLTQVSMDAPNGVHAIIDHRPEDYLGADIAMAAPMGRVVIFSGGRGKVDARQTRDRELSLHYLGISNLVRNPALADVREVLADVLAVVARGDLTVRIADTFALEEAARAHAALDQESFVGKLIFEP